MSFAIGNLVDHTYGIYKVVSVVEDKAILQLIARKTDAIGKDIPLTIEENVKNLNVFAYNPPQYLEGEHIRTRSGLYGTINAVTYSGSSDFVYSVKYDSGWGRSGIRADEM